MMINHFSQLESFKSNDRVEIQCSKCNGVRESKVSSLRSYFKNHLNYVCHKCKVHDNIGGISEKLKINARKKGYVVNDFIEVVCGHCSNKFNVRIKNMRSNMKRNNGVYSCSSCSLSRAHDNGKFNNIYNSDFKNKLNKISKDFWTDENKNTWKSRIVTDDFRKSMSEYGKRAWAIDEYRKKMFALRLSPEYRSKLSEWSKMAWTPEFRKMMSDINTPDIMSKRGELGWAKLNGSLSDEEINRKYSIFGRLAWIKPEFREKVLLELKSNINFIIDESYFDSKYRDKMAIVRLNQPKTSHQQKILYSLLNDLNIEFSDDSSILSKIGYYTFDCRIDPQPNINIKKSILIEVQGDYWHNRPNTIAKDKSKSTYLKTYFSEYDLKYLWEHEFDNKDRVINLIRYWVGLPIPNKIEFSFKDVVMKVVNSQEAEYFIAKYHYAGRIGRSGINLGFYLGDELIAVIIFCYPMRSETAVKQGCCYREILELTRLAIHPQYQVKNLASFIIGLSIRHIRDNNSQVKKLVSFSDLTYNHSGMIYRASNWRFDGEVNPGYWYADDNGYICHKKTLWDKAKKMSMTESEYCEKYKYVKIHGDKKFRYVFDLCV